MTGVIRIDDIDDDDNDNDNDNDSWREDENNGAAAESMKKLRQQSSKMLQPLVSGVTPLPPARFPKRASKRSSARESTESFLLGVTSIFQLSQIRSGFSSKLCCGTRWWTRYDEVVSWVPCNSEPGKASAGICPWKFSGRGPPEDPLRSPWGAPANHAPHRKSLRSIKLFWKMPKRPCNFRIVALLNERNGDFKSSLQCFRTVL